MVHHHHSPPSSSAATTSSPSIKPERSAAAAVALQSALSLPTPMNVNVSMNFNSHSVQYSTGYGTGSSATNFVNSPYDTFYNPTATSHYPFTNHSPEIKSNRSTNYLQPDPVTTKQAMLLSAAAANCDYKDFSKLCDFFPTPSSSSSTSLNPNEKRKYDYSILFYLKVFHWHDYLVIGQHQNHLQIPKRMKDESIVVEFAVKSMQDQVHLKRIYVHIQVKKYVSFF